LHDPLSAMKKHLRSYLVVVASLGALLVAPSGAGAEATKLLEHASGGSPPKLTVELDRSTYVLHAPIGVRFIVSNPSHTDTIATLLSIAFMPLESSQIKLRVLDPGMKDLSWYGVPRAMLLLRKNGGAGVLQPEEAISAAYKILLHADRPGSHSLTAFYYWHASLSPGLEQYAASEKVPFSVISPEGIDKKVVDLVGNPDLLGALQDRNGLGPAGIKYAKQFGEVTRLRLEILDRFPDSVYAESILFAHAYGLLKGAGETDPMRIVRGEHTKPQEALGYFKRFLDRYPTSWYADEAMIFFAECQSAVGERAQAAATLSGLVSLHRANPWLQRQAEGMLKRLREGRPVDQ